MIQTKYYRFLKGKKNNLKCSIKKKNKKSTETWQRLCCSDVKYFAELLLSWYHVLLLLMCRGKKRERLCLSPYFLFWSQIHVQCQREKYYPSHRHLSSEYKTLYQNLILEKISQRPCESYEPTVIRSWRI